MLPTEAQVIEYVSLHPGCKSKDIAKHYGCSTTDINRPRDGYGGIYKLAGLTQRNFCHFSTVSDTGIVSDIVVPAPVPAPVPVPVPAPVPAPVPVPVPAPVQEPVVRRIRARIRPAPAPMPTCDICLEPFQAWELQNFRRCCNFRCCLECERKTLISPCPGCRFVFNMGEFLTNLDRQYRQARVEQEQQVLRDEADARRWIMDRY
jgi:hypothetical protein